MTAEEFLAGVTACCRDCGKTFPFAEHGKSVVDDADGFVRCVACRDGAKPPEREHDAGPLFGTSRA